METSYFKNFVLGILACLSLNIGQSATPPDVFVQEQFTIIKDQYAQTIPQFSLEGKVVTFPDKSEYQVEMYLQAQENLSTASSVE